MKIDNEWLRASLALGMHLSCGMLALSTLYIYAGLRDEGAIPQRFFVILPVCFFVLTLVVFFADEAMWKTILKLLVYTVSISLIGVLVYGIRVTIGAAAGDAGSGSLVHGVVALFFAAPILWGCHKLLASKWLN